MVYIGNRPVRHHKTNQDAISTPQPRNTTAGKSIPEGGIPNPSRDENTDVGSSTDPPKMARMAKEAATKSPPVASISLQMSPRLRSIANISDLEQFFDAGYDSDGELGPFSNLEEVEGVQMFDEEPAPQNPPQTQETSPEAQISPELDATATQSSTPPPVHIPIEEEALVSMKREEIKVELALRGQKVYGRKEDMLLRLREALQNKIPVNLSNTTMNNKMKSTKKKKKQSITGFPDSAFWKVLDADEDVALEPENPSFKNPRAPTIDEKDATRIPQKHNFSKYSFPIPMFTGKTTRVARYASGTIKKHRNGYPKYEEVVREEGQVEPNFINKHGITKKSTPDEYAELFLPFRKNNSAGKEWLSFEQIQKWTNLKASLAGAGPGGTCYKEFKPFSVTEIRQHFGLYILQGLNPSPQIEWKLKPQREDKIHGNDFVFRSLGVNAERRQRHFKAFLATQDPRIDPPDRKLYPNWKIRPILKWINYIMPQAWQLGKSFSVDEMTMGFKGNHRDKKRITYKAEGDGFQCDALCQNGYTFQIWMRNDLAPKKYITQGLSPLHSRVMGLFDTVSDTYHHCAMDNLYNSAAFCKAAFNHPMKILAHGVARKGLRGIPKCVMQDEVKNRTEQLLVRGTVKAAVLEGDPSCPNLLASSVYDTKPVHYLSMATDKLQWTEVSKAVYNIDSGEVEYLRFLRMNTIHKYNSEMGGVDLADQLRGSYRMDKWVRNRKWWWSILFWGIGVLLTNAYIVYVYANVLHFNTKKKYLLSHHDFRRAIAEAWLNPEEYEKSQKLAQEQEQTENFVKKRKLAVSTTSTVASSVASSITMNSSKSIYSAIQKEQQQGTKKHCKHVNDDSLDPTSSLCIRLDSTLDHLPDPANGRARCSLHRWLGIETQKQVSYCTVCNVHLCVRCYRIFHTVPDMSKIKDELLKDLQKK